MAKRRTVSLAERYWAKVDTSGGPDDCWPWTAATNEHGYGVIRPEGRRDGPALKAHRLALIFAGRDPGGRPVRHIVCDNPPCQNPSHLLAGTQKQNIEDMVSRGRGLVGSKNGKSKLTEDDVRQIRKLISEGVKGMDIAARFGVAQARISEIKNGKAWTHVK